MNSGVSTLQVCLQGILYYWLQPEDAVLRMCTAIFTAASTVMQRMCEAYQAWLIHSAPGTGQGLILLVLPHSLNQHSAILSHWSKWLLDLLQEFIILTEPCSLIQDTLLYFPHYLLSPEEVLVMSRVQVYQTDI